MRWPALVALDEAGGPLPLLDILDWVCTRLGISQEQRAFTKPKARRPLVLVRLAKALRDLDTAGAIESVDSGGLAITDDGRRMTEETVVELPSA